MAGSKQAGAPRVNPTASQQIRMKALEFAFRHPVGAPSELRAVTVLEVAKKYEDYIAG